MAETRNQLCFVRFGRKKHVFLIIEGQIHGFSPGVFPGDVFSKYLPNHKAFLWPSRVTLVLLKMCFFGGPTILLNWPALRPSPCLKGFLVY